MKNLKAIGLSLAVVAAIAVAALLIPVSKASTPTSAAVIAKSGNP